MEQVIDFIVSNYIWFLIGLGVIILAIIGYIAEKIGAIGNKKTTAVVEEETIDFSDVSKPKDNEEETNNEKKEVDISADFDTLPDVEENIEEDLYAPFGDQEIIPKEETNDISVEEVEDANYKQDFVDVEKIQSEATDIINTEDKKDVDDLMKEQFDMDFGFEEEKKEKLKKEPKKESKKEEDIDDMWKF